MYVYICLYDYDLDYKASQEWAPNVKKKHLLLEHPRLTESMRPRFCSTYPSIMGTPVWILQAQGAKDPHRRYVSRTIIAIPHIETYRNPTYSISGSFDAWAQHAYNKGCTGETTGCSRGSVLLKRSTHRVAVESLY